MQPGFQESKRITRCLAVGSSKGKSYMYIIHSIQSVVVLLREQFRFA